MCSVPYDKKGQLKCKDPYKFLVSYWNRLQNSKVNDIYKLHLIKKEIKILKRCVDRQSYFISYEYK